MPRKGNNRRRPPSEDDEEADNLMVLDQSNRPGTRPKQSGTYLPYYFVTFRYFCYDGDFWGKFCSTPVYLFLDLFLLY